MTKPPIQAVPTRVDRILAHLIVALILLSLASFAIIVIRGVAGQGMGEGLWPAVVLFPVIGLPLGFIFVVVLLWLSAVRRSRAAKDALR